MHLQGGAGLWAGPASHRRYTGPGGVLLFREFPNLPYLYLSEYVKYSYLCIPYHAYSCIYIYIHTHICIYI